MAYKLQDMQEIQTSIAFGNVSATQAVTTGLVQQDGATPLDPDAIVAEVVAFAAGGGAATHAWVEKIVRAAGTGNFTATIAVDADPGGAFTAKATVRYSSIYWHPIQGADHTP